MPPSDRLLTFAVVAVVLVLVPGPSVLFAVTRSLTLGARAGLATVVGNAAGAYVQVVAVAVDVGALVRESVHVLTAIKLLGAAYLVFLGVQTFRHRRSLVAALHAPVERRLPLRVLADAFVVGLLNPKLIAFFMAILPQFVDRTAGAVPAQLLALGAVFCLIALVCDSLWALAAGTARTWLTRSPRRLEAVGASGGVTMIALGAGLALSGRRD